MIIFGIPVGGNGLNAEEEGMDDSSETADMETASESNGEVEEYSCDLSMEGSSSGDINVDGGKVRFEQGHLEH